MHIVSSSVTFPPVRWWAQVLKSNEITIDCAEHFQKMSYRNRYNISGANNPIQLTVPLINGRDQRLPMNEVLIYNEDNWQVQHWRTLVSVYKRSPYWEFYEPTLQPLFSKVYTHLTDFNKDAFEWVNKQLKTKIIFTGTDTYIHQYPEGTTDLRTMKPATEKVFLATFPRYYQLFEDRIGFQPNLSILDLLFSEGPATVAWIKQNLQ